MLNEPCQQPPKFFLARISRVLTDGSHICLLPPTRVLAKKKIMQFRGQTNDRHIKTNVSHERKSLTKEFFVGQNQ